jgi:hypothetical protein
MISAIWRFIETSDTEVGVFCFFFWSDSVLKTLFFSCPLKLGFVLFLKELPCVSLLVFFGLLLVCESLNACCDKWETGKVCDFFSFSVV